MPSGVQGRSSMRRHRNRQPAVPNDTSLTVNYDEPFDRTFAVLVDPTRRAILARLERGSPGHYAFVITPCRAGSTRPVGHYRR
jgi:hypothetical protein